MPGKAGEGDPQSRFVCRAPPRHRTPSNLLGPIDLASPRKNEFGIWLPSRTRPVPVPRSDWQVDRSDDTLRAGTASPCYYERINIWTKKKLIEEIITRQAPVPSTAAGVKILCPEYSDCQPRRATKFQLPVPFCIRLCQPFVCLWKKRVGKKKKVWHHQLSILKGNEMILGSALIEKSSEEHNVMPPLS